MMTVSYCMYEQRLFSDSEIKNLSWRGLAVQHAESLENIKFWRKAVVERRKRNEELKRPRRANLIDRETMLRVAQLNECCLQAEIKRREGAENRAALFASLKRMAAIRPKGDGENVVPSR
jgi:hypothetical protein